MSNTNKVRVYELAKEFGYTSKDFLDLLKERGVEAHSNFSVLEDATVKTVREMLKKDGGAAKPAKAAKADKPEKTEKSAKSEKAERTERAAAKAERSEKRKERELPPPEEKIAAAAAPAASATPEVRRMPGGGSTVVTTIDAERAASITMARSSTGPKPKVGGEVRRIIPAARLDALRTVAPPGTAPRPTEGTAAATSAVAVSRPAATTTTTAPPRTSVAPAGAPATAVRASETPARPAAAPVAQRPATAGGVAVPARPAAAARPATAAPLPRPTAPGKPAEPPLAAAPTAESADKRVPPAPAAAPSATEAAPAPAVAPSSGPLTAPPPRPTRGSGPAVMPAGLPTMPQFPQRPMSPPPQQAMRPGFQGGRRGSSRGMERPHQQQRRRGGPGSKPSSVAVVAQAPPVELKDFEMPDHISVTDLAAKLEISPTEIIKTLMSQGLLVTINQTITFDKAQQIALSHGYNAVLTEEHEEIVQEEEDQDTLVTRPPVVTVLGHVDHGKTSLLDAIRKTNVTAGEAGGITQSIGAYTVDHNGRRITFIDTPGHEAFTAMRARGAQVTDVAVLVVAADDGVMPQTVEAINHAKAAKVPIVVAVNKVDKPQANVDRVKQQLTEYDLVAEDWGGQTIVSGVSAKQNQGIDELLEMILLVADLQELKANPARKAHGIIIEGKLDKGLGPVATVLVQTGTLRVGDSVVCGQTYGKVRALINDRGDRIKKAGPAIPAEIIGLSGVPEAGDVLQVVDDEKIARQITEARTHRVREKAMGPTSRTTLDDLYKQLQAGEVKDLNLIVKADGQGSVEALKHSLLRLSSAEVRVVVVHGGVGTITESDILLATASSAIIIGFNVRPDPNVKKLAEQEGVDIRNYRVIYHVIEDIKAAMKGLLSPEYQEVILGRVEVRQVFKVSKVGTIAGCYVADGKVVRGADVRLLRDNAVVYEGKIESLKRFKDDAREVQAGFECGLGIEKYNNIQVGDVIEVFKMEEKPRE